MDIGGSFLASTASSIKFADSTQFSAKDFQSVPLLTVSIPLGLQYGENPGSTGSNVIGGNININTGVLAAFEDSDISANSLDFRGGQVKIKTEGIFGIQFRRANTPLSDITASGASSEYSGTVQVNRPDFDPSQGLVELPVNLVDTSQQVATGCNPGGRQRKGSFTATGRSRLPPIVAI